MMKLIYIKQSDNTNILLLIVVVWPFMIYTQDDLISKNQSVAWTSNPFEHFVFTEKNGQPEPSTCFMTDGSEPINKNTLYDSGANGVELYFHPNGLA